MASQPGAVARGGQEFGGPVEYDSIRVPLQTVRLAAAGTLAGLAAFASPYEFGDILRLVAFGLVVLDATLRIAVRQQPFHFLVVDAVLLTAAIGTTAGDVAPAVLLIAYLVVAGALLLTPLMTGLVLIPAVVGIGIRAILNPFELGAIGTRTDIYDASTMLVAITLLTVTAGARLRAATRRQEVALDAERRASEMKNEFVSMVSHELRTPLTNITGFALAAQESWRSIEPEEVDEYLGIICSEADHLKNLVDDVLTIPRLDAGRLHIEPADFHLRPAAFRIAELIFPPGGEHSASVSVPSSAVVHADPNRVEQVLRNLLENARKYGGPEIQIEAVRHPEELVIVVADNGAGVPETDREKIFDRFQQLAAGSEPTGTGIGLGLTISRRLVEAMEGRIWYEPGFPVGARFCFTLPIGDPAAATAVTPPAAEDARYSPPGAEPTLHPSDTGVGLTA